MHAESDQESLILSSEWNLIGDNGTHTIWKKRIKLEYAVLIEEEDKWIKRIMGKFIKTVYEKRSFMKPL